ncbi:MAG: phospho-sugar mutase [Fusobacteriaceae bacterium]
MNSEVMKKYNEWLESPYVEQVDKDELKSLEGDLKEVEDRFYTDLSFGTGGMRGIRGVGSNRINKYTIRKATQGLADYINEVADGDKNKKSAVIAHDCRIGSIEYALNAAQVLAANGIKTYIFDSMRSTPELSFAVRELKTQAGIVITASHNPQEYNGYKVYWNDGGQLVEPHASGVVNGVNNVTSFEMIRLMDEKTAREEGLIVTVGTEQDDKFIEAVKKQALNIKIPGKNKFKIVYSPLHGTGGRPVLRVLKEMGFDSVYPVMEQLEGDGMFPTCPYANPEDPAVFKLGIELAEKIGADIAMANDPDADRIGIACKDKNGQWHYPNGNQMGLLLMNYILENRKNIPQNGAVISTIVSTPMLDAIAQDKGVKIFRTLTGFKFIGEKIREFESGLLDGEYVFGFEESYGYLIGTHARDKDAVVSTMIIAEMAAYYNSIGTSILEELGKLYEKYGWYREGITAITKKGKEGMAEIIAIMEKLRGRKNSKELIGEKVAIFKDFKAGIEVDFRTGETKRIDLPVSDVIQFILADNTYITARPSGTEPKMKYYYCVTADTEKASQEKLEHVMKKFEETI